MPEIIRLDHIFFRHRGPGGAAGRPVLEDFSLRIEKGEKLIVKGRSGSGKSTLLRLIAWLEEPDAGRMFFGGKPYESYSPPALRRRVSLVGQTPVTLDGTVRGNMALGLEEKPGDAVFFDWMDRLGLERELLDREAKSLSLGQKQRVAVIRNLVMGPDVILLDEPTSGLDAVSARMFIGAMERLIKETGLTAVWVSHDIEVLKETGARTLTLGEAAR